MIPPKLGFLVGNDYALSADTRKISDRYITCLRHYVRYWHLDYFSGCKVIEDLDSLTLESVPAESL